MGPILKKIVIQQNFQLPTPNSLGLCFSKCWQEWKIGIGHYGKMTLISWKIIIQQNLQLLTSPKFGSSRFSVYSTSHLCVILHFLIIYSIQSILANFTQRAVLALKQIDSLALLKKGRIFCASEFSVRNLVNLFSGCIVKQRLLPKIFTYDQSVCYLWCTSILRPS